MLADGVNRAEDLKMHGGWMGSINLCASLGVKRQKQAVRSYVMWPGEVCSGISVCYWGNEYRSSNLPNGDCVMRELWRHENL
jgi:hypothetical protein